MMKRLMVSVFVLLILFSAAACAEEKAGEGTPSCEIKLLIDSSLSLDGEHLLAENLRDQFQTGDAYKTTGAVYLDTADREFLSAGWINRIRVKDGKKKYTLTYKKRYPVEGNDVEAALAEAAEDGFTLTDPEFTAEIDWGYADMTLSFSRDVDLKTDGPPDIDLLKTEDAVRMIKAHMPPSEKDQGGREETADNVKLAGPVHYLRYSGTFGGQEIRFEIWSLPEGEEITYVVELSAKCESVEEAAGRRDQLIKALDEMGILIHSDALKTRMILGGI